jgi:hypothetical protein
MAYTSCQRRNYSHGIVSLSFLYIIILLSQRRWLRQSRVTYSCIASHAQLPGNMYYYCPLGLLGFWRIGYGDDTVNVGIEIVHFGFLRAKFFDSAAG